MDSCGANGSLWLRLMEGDGSVVAGLILRPQLKKASRNPENCFQTANSGFREAYLRDKIKISVADTVLQTR